MMTDHGAGNVTNIYGHRGYVRMVEVRLESGGWVTIPFEDFAVLRCDRVYDQNWGGH